MQRWAVMGPDSAPDVSFVPPLLRRRLSPLQRMFFALARSVGAEDAGWVVFASRDGEDTITRRMAADFTGDNTVSPNRFSSSVYNAAPGLWSIFAQNRSPYTAIAGGDDTIECGLLELLTVRDVGDAVLVYAEETDGGYGAAVRIGATGKAVVVSQAIHQAPEPITFQNLACFLRGESHALSGKWLALLKF
jgi:hypothetical protein